MEQLKWHGMGYRSISGGELVRLGRDWPATGTAPAATGMVGIAVERWHGQPSALTTAHRVVITVLMNGDRLNIPEAFLEVEDTSRVLSGV